MNLVTPFKPVVAGDDDAEDTRRFFHVGELLVVHRVGSFVIFEVGHVVLGLFYCDA